MSDGLFLRRAGLGARENEYKIIEVGDVVDRAQLSPRERVTLLEHACTALVAEDRKDLGGARYLLKSAENCRRCGAEPDLVEPLKQLATRFIRARTR